MGLVDSESQNPATSGSNALKVAEEGERQRWVWLRGDAGFTYY